MTKNFTFWNKFSRYLLIGLSSLVIFAGVQSGVLGDFTQRGPDQVLADEDACGEPDQPGCPNPGYDGGEVPMDQPPAPTLPPAVPQPPAPTPSCPDDLTYCDTNINRLIHKHGGYYDPNHSLRDGRGCVYAFDDIGACGVPTPAPQPTSPPGTQCTPNDQIRTTQHCQPGTTLWCTYNIWRGSDCSEGEGGAYGCVNDPRCGYSQPQPTTPPPPQPTSPPQPPAPANCPVNSSCCSPGLQRCSAHGYDASCPAGFRWCYGGFCVHENYNPATNNCAAGAPPPQPPPPQQPTPQPPVCQNTTEKIQECSGVRLCTINVIRDCYGRQISRSAPYNCFNSTECGYRVPTPPPDCPISTIQVCLPGATLLCTYNVRTCTGTRGAPYNCFNAAQCGYTPPISPTPPPGQPPIIINNPPPNITINTPHSQTQTTGPVTQTVTSPAQVTLARTFGTVESMPTARVAGVAVKELPKTGLPALAWAALAFIPAGFKIRGFSKIKEEAAGKAHFLWEDRQFKA